MALLSLLTRGLIMIPLCVAVICLVRKANEVASEIGATMAGAVHGGRYYDDDGIEDSEEGAEDAGGWVALPGQRQQEQQQGGSGSMGGWRWWSWQAGGHADADGEEEGAGEGAAGAPAERVVTKAGAGGRQDGLQGMCVACMAAPATVGFLHTPPPPPPPTALSQPRYRGAAGGGGSSTSSGGRSSSGGVGGGGGGGGEAAASLLVHNCLCAPCWERLRRQGRGQRCPVCNQRAPSLNVVRT
ncbi:hypothetical protein HYH02_013541 [Chlamydomonas schloesseri]|uniref:RING-type domain-containing protein n=1 Tax=Chlamydomonas schloesseri TaxID=2026947 RepID=A0A835ST70_9CHLO|nr:hypothetical protein HYH02_013541 [Chlamydomonas schloesseri]|eukprot:KAG2431012.1 hypothetical protein HYH02_013541 [Chlamydomonas schloesseri]